MSEWIKVCAIDEIAVLSARQLRVGGLVIALVRAEADRVYAIEDRCPHKGGPLSEGIVSQDRIACPLHGQCVDLASGAMLAPDEGQVRCFDVHLAGGAVLMKRAQLQAAAAMPAAAAPACAAACAT